MKKLNKSDYDSVQLEYLTNAEKLQSELINNGFLATRIEKGEDSLDFEVIFFDGENDYIIRRDYNENVYITRKDWPSYKHVSNSRKNELYKNIHISNNVKVITQKKLERLLEEVKSYHIEASKLEEKAKDTINNFLDSIKNLPFVYHREDHTNPLSEIKSGEMVKNGIEFSFTIHEDGYISKKISKYYAVHDTLENFLLLSDNKYISRD